MGRKPYPSDLTGTQREPVAPRSPAVTPGGRPRKYDMREVLSGTLYVDAGGRRWRAVAHDLPHRKTCDHVLRAFEADGTWGGLVTAPRAEVRARPGRHPTPGGGCIDSQSAETAAGGAGVGTDGGGRSAGGSGTSPPTRSGCCRPCW